MIENAEKPDIRAGLVAGAIGGIAGGAVKMLCEMIAPPRPPGRQAPPAVLAENLSEALGGNRLTDKQRTTSANVAHWIFSIASSAVYGAIVELWPSARSGFGTVFGDFVWLGFHEFALPLLGATPKLPDLPISEQTNEFVSHAIFGATVEAVRGLIRGVA